MRKILLDKHKYTYKDVFRWIGITLLYYIGFYIYIMAIFGFRYIGHIGDDFIPIINSKNWGLLYPMSIGALVSAILHIIYAERGATSVKAILWFHVLICAIILLVVIFIG